MSNCIAALESDTRSAALSENILDAWLGSAVKRREIAGEKKTV